MVRQKYHDQKLSWQKFKKGDQVYVYFPLRKAGLSPKFTSYWRGPYEILDRITDNTYNVNCWSRGKSRVVHADRLRLKHNQVLQNEPDINEESSAEDLGRINQGGKESDTCTDIASEVDSNLETLRSGIVRKAPSWFSDYVVY